MQAEIRDSKMMAKEAALDVIRDIFALKGINIDRVILFGSRARGDANRDSDWDFLVIVDKDLAFKEKNGLIVQIKRRLAKLGIPNDILVQSRSRFDAMKTQPGHISYVANREGVPA